MLFWSTYLIWLICEIFLAVTSFQRWFLIFLKCFRLWPLLIIEYQILFETYLLWTHLINVQKNIFVKYFCLWRRGAAYGFIHSLGMKIDGGPTLHWTKQYLLNVIREPFKNYLAENHFAKQLKRNGHTSYLSRTRGRRPCKFFLVGVNFHRFNAKNWHFRQILRKKVAFFLQI